MLSGEQITRISVWLALGAGTLGFALRRGARGRPAWRDAALLVWTLGCASFLVHVAAAFTTFHHWSHQSAYDEVARQTAAFSGFHWGGGIYFNYLFAATWLGDTLWWWIAPGSWARRPARLDNIWHGFFFFMMVNGAIVFVHGPARWLGVFLCAAFAACWWRTRRRDTLGAHPSRPD